MATAENEIQSENENDSPYLYVLEIFYYILAVLSFLAGLIKMYQFYQLQVAQRQMSNLLSGIQSQNLLPNYQAPQLQNISVVAIFSLGFTITLGIVQFGTANSLKNRHNYTFCLVVAAVGCLSGSLAGIVGVATFFVLVRPSVKRIFQRPEI